MSTVKRLRVPALDDEKKYTVYKLAPWFKSMMRRGHKVVKLAYAAHETGWSWEDVFSHLGYTHCAPKQDILALFRKTGLDPLEHGYCFGDEELVWVCKELNIPTGELIKLRYHTEPGESELTRAVSLLCKADYPIEGIIFGVKFGSLSVRKRAEVIRGLLEHKGIEAILTAVGPFLPKKARGRFEFFLRELGVYECHRKRILALLK